MNSGRAMLDAATAAPLHPAARQALEVALDRAWADPTQVHHEGRVARLHLDAARESVAASLGISPAEIFFTSGGTDALTDAVSGVLRDRRADGATLITSAVEHSAVLRVADAYADAGGSVRTLGVDRLGRIALDDLQAGLSSGAPVAAVCVQAGNQEVGTRQPIEEVSDALGSTGIPLVMDASQALGRIPLPAGWQVLAASARPWGGPPGVGILAVRAGSRWRARGQVHDRERGRSPGFSGIPFAVAAAAALEAVVADRARDADVSTALIDRARAAISTSIPDVEMLGDPVHRLPHILAFSCLYADGESLVTELDRRGIAVASGSACTSDQQRPSHVLAAMGVLTGGNVRLTLPLGCPTEHVDRFLAVLPEVVAQVRSVVQAGGCEH